MKEKPMLRFLIQRISACYRVAILGLMGLNFASLLLVSRPAKALEYLMYSLFHWRAVRGSGLPIVQFHELFPSTPSQIDITFLPRYSEYIGMLEGAYTKDLIYLALLARILSPQVVFEIGTFKGHSALLFALNTPTEATIYTLDLPKGRTLSPILATTMIDDAHIAGHSRVTNYLYEGNPCSRKIKQLFGDSAEYDFHFLHKKVDLFFIDGAHSYEYVRADTLNALKCSRPGSVIVWHDYGRWGVNGVSRWLHAFSKTNTVYRLPGSSLAIMKV